MEAGVWLVVKHKDENALIKGLPDSQLIEIRKIICGKWCDLGISNFAMHCSFGVVQKLLLKSQDDYENMFQLCQQLGAKMVDIAMSVPIECGSPPNPNVVSEHRDKLPELIEQGAVSAYSIYSNFDFKNLASSSGNLDDGEQDEFSGQFRPPPFNVCPDIDVTPVLSLNWKDSITGEGQIFRGGRDQFRTALILYASKRRFLFDYAKNNAKYVYANCREKANGCEWFIRGRECHVTGCFSISKCNLVHGCLENIIKSDSKRLGPKIWGKLIAGQVKGKHKHPGVAMKQHIKLSYGFDVEYTKAYRAVQSANTTMHGSYSKSFDKLSDYCEAAVATNPGSRAFVVRDEKTRCFNRAFFAWKACLDGFKSCRPMISVDGTHMYGRWRGVILSATAKDGNNGLFPIAIALVTVENLDNWIWFLEQLRDILQHDKQIFYLSDRNAGLMSAFDIVFEEPVHFYCLFHLHNNLKSFYGGPWSNTHRKNMCKLLTECAYATNVACFEASLLKFIATGKGLAEKFLEGLELKYWAYAFAPNIKRYGEMTSNAAESFNNWIKVARGLPVTNMVETIRADIMRWFVERREDAESWTSILCTRRQDIWNFFVDASQTWHVSKCPNGTYVVHSTPSVVVSLTNQTCSCHQWQIHGFPCVHATATILKFETSIRNVVDKCFFADAYKAAYSPNLNPVPDTALLELPPRQEVCATKQVYL